jgi:recombination protein RecT
VERLAVSGGLIMVESTRPQLVAPRARPPATVGELLGRDGETIERLRAVATRYLPPERALRLAVMAVRRTPRLAQCDPASFMGSLMSASGLGLEPNTVKGHAYLIPFEMRRPKRENGRIVTDQDGKWVWETYYECQFQIGYKGFVALFYRTGLITEVTAEAIHDGDKFEHRKGSENYLRYEKALGSRGELLGAFCFTRLKDGEAFTVLPADEIYKVRGRSQTWRTLSRNLEEAENDRERVRAERLLAETPWVMWESEMAAKTAIKRHGKQVDIDSPLLAVAADIDGLADAGALDIRAMTDPEFATEIIQGNEEVPTSDDDPAPDGHSEPAAAEPANAPGPPPAAAAREPARRRAPRQVEPPPPSHPVVANTPNRPEEPADRSREDTAAAGQPPESVPQAGTAGAPTRSRRVNFEM